MQDSQHRDLEGGPCLPTKINSLAQVIFSISQQKSPFEAVNLSIQIQGATRLSSITSFCLFSLRKRDLGLQGEFLSPVLSWPGADPALLWGKVSGKGTQGLCSPRWVLSLPMGHGRTQGALGKSGNAEGSSQLLLSSITHHRLIPLRVALRAWHRAELSLSHQEPDKHFSYLLNWPDF